MLQYKRSIIVKILILLQIFYIVYWTHKCKLMFKILNLKCGRCIVIAFVLTIFCVVKTFQMSDPDKKCCLSSLSSTLSDMRCYSLLSNGNNLYQTMDLKCNNGSLHRLLTSVFNVSMDINRLATNLRHVLPRDAHFYELMENGSLKMQSSIMDIKNKVVGLNRKFR